MTLVSLNKNDIDLILTLQKDNFSDGWNYEQLLSGFNANLKATALKDGQRVVGFITYSLALDVADIEGVVVINSERKKGYGKMLVQGLLEELKRNSARSVLLEVRESNLPAIALYSACGFNQISVRRKYYSDGENALIMQKEL